MKEKIEYFLKKHKGILINSQSLEFDNKFGGKSLVCFYLIDKNLLCNSFHEDPKNSGRVRLNMNIAELEDHLEKYLK